MDHNVTHTRIHMMERWKWEVYDFFNSGECTLVLKQNNIIKGFSTSLKHCVDELHVEEFFIPFGKLFQAIGPEYEMLILRLGFGILIRFWNSKVLIGNWSQGCIIVSETSRKHTEEWGYMQL